MAAEVSTPASEIDTGRLADSQRVRTWTIIAVIALFGEVATLQYTMVSPAALLIAPSFPGVGANVSWMTTIFGLVGGLATPLAGKASDLWGKKRLLMISGAVFVVGSLICVLSGSDWPLFLVGRACEALALGNMTVAYGLFRDLLPRKYIPMALGVTVTGFGLSAIAAPLLAGYLTQHGSWRSIFWFLTIYGVVSLALVVALVPETKLRVKQRLDVLGALILSGGMALCLIYLSNGPSWGWGRPSSLLYLAAGLVLLAVFIPVERRTAQPIIDIDLLLSPRVTMTLAAYFFGSLAVGAMAYALPLMLQTPTAAGLIHSVYQQTMAQSHLSAAQASALLQVNLNDGLKYAAGVGLIGYALHAALFQGGAGMITGPASGWWSARVGARKPVIVSFIAFVVASALLLTTSQHGVWFYALSAGVFGVGYGVTFAAAPSLIMDAVPPRQQGISSGMLAVVGALGSALSTAIVTAFIDANPLIMTVKAAGKVVKTVNLTTEGSLTTWNGFLGVLWVVGAASVLGLVIALVMKHGRAPASGGEVSEAL